tara:strand:- start:18 stop:209 length:192 start_codon:yes stop_codon:yes gene_type:complete
MLALVESRQVDGLMSKKKSIYDSGTTKGSAPRTSDYKKYSDNYDKIFGKKDKTKNEKRKSSNS